LNSPTKSPFAVGRPVGHDHVDHDGQPVGGVEHALGAAQADAHGAVAHGALGVVGRVGVRAHLEPRPLVRPPEQRAQRRREVRLHRRHLAAVDLAGAAVEGDHVAFLDHLLAREGDASRRLHSDAFGPGDAGLAHAARHDGRVGSLAAAARQDALGSEEAVDVLGLGLLADQDHLDALAAERLGAVGIEHGLAARRTRRGGQPGGQRLALVPGIEAREQHLLELRGIDPRERLVLRQQPFLMHLDRGAHP